MTGERRPRPATSLRTLIVGGAAALGVVLFASIAGLLILTTRMQSALAREARSLLVEQQLVDQINREVGRQLLDAADYLSDPRAAALDRFQARGERVYGGLRSYLFRDLSLAQRRQVERVKELHQELEVRAHDAFEQRRLGAKTPASDRMMPLFDGAAPLQNALDEFLAMRTADYNGVIARQRLLLTRLYAGAGVLAALLTIAILLAVGLVRRRLLIPLDDLSRTADQLGSGDLGARVLVRYDDELSRVGGSFNGMAASLASLEAELRRSEDRYRGLIELSPDAILVEREGRIVLVNGEAARRFGVPRPEALIGSALLDLVHPDARPLAAARLAEIELTHHQLAPVELVFVKRDGSSIHGELAAAPIEYDEREALLVVVRDVTARKNAETALQAVEAQLRQAQKMEAVGRLAGGIAHDFNNLLTVIGSYGEMLLSSMSTDDPRRVDVLEIRDAAHRAGKLTGQLLAFSRKQVLRPMPININEVMHGMSALLRRIIAADIELKIDLEASLDLVEADQGQMEQVILNLAVNARDAMPDGGCLTIRTRNAQLGENPTRPYVVLAVSDTGVGMDPETQERIFEPFFTTKEIGKGTGLGLSTVYGIVQQSGGQVRVWSEPSRGSTFEILLPRIQKSEALEPAPPAAIDAPGGDETILVVEDEATVRALAKRMLRASGYTVLEAMNGDVALRVADEHDGVIDLLLTDVVMPGMGGRELADRIASSHPETKVLFTSGHTEDEVLRRGILAHTEHFLAKPYSPQTMLAGVRSVLDSAVPGRHAKRQ
jgi:PAS domain S-box-containing protein